MAKKTLLEIVQDILNDMNADPVNSIEDTIEAGQVAMIVKSTYESLVNNRDWPYLNRTIQLTGLANPYLPTHVQLQDNIKELIFVKYDCIKPGETRHRYTDMKYIDPDSFLRMTNMRNSDDPNTQLVAELSGFPILLLKNKDPEYYTSFNDTQIIFDSYNNLIDSTIQTSKIQAYAQITPNWSHTNNAIPDLPLEAFPLLVEESKSRAMYKLNQATDEKSEQESRRQNRWLSRKSYRVNGGMQYPNYGRRGYYNKDVTFEKNK